ncbi:hypothetical protein AN958_11801 [Leucoagaricus sp. SymC.cos]|nr:hypothetical protein AN958_11801 [Leucoagaricus sp. SymC.cos]
MHARLSPIRSCIRLLPLLVPGCNGSPTILSQPTSLHSPPVARPSTGSVRLLIMRSITKCGRPIDGAILGHLGYLCYAQHPLPSQDMLPCLWSDSQTRVAIYFDAEKPRLPLGRSSRRLIAQSLRTIWPAFLDGCSSYNIKGPICGVVVNRKHRTIEHRVGRLTVRLFDRHNYEIATLHAPMPWGEEKDVWWTTSIDRKRDGLDFRAKYKRIQTVDLSISPEVPQQPRKLL